ncbi:lipopolysaccharide biosynthesis protein [Spirosoma sp. HMF3257]|uniref:Lipopolysaccharide biosynthesis protein n=1 Tax=Spirosoma telluris TaxID=2183553 RepID=A0A327NQP5_9BACT|nr:lipopolysaccharide biosynthesis protein [Spirosoma telluris]RAI76104.1 lipopolysaccharide biosynthesis protein [Spirosoma telluris]
MSAKEARGKDIKDTIDEDEIKIRLSDAVLFLKGIRWTIIRWAGAFFILGILYALSQQNEFIATVKVMPEHKTGGGSGGLGDLKSLAGLAGVNLDNLNGLSEAIRPDLYPDILQSVPFSLYLLNQPVTTLTSQKPQSLQSYLIEQDQKGITRFLGSLFTSDPDESLTTPSSGSTLRLTKLQETLVKDISQRVGAAMDKKSGIITINAQMPDPIVVATVASQAMDYLAKYVTHYRTEKSRKQVDFLKQQISDARSRYETAEFALSSYRDRNRSIYLNTAKIEEQRLQADYLLAQTVYTDLSKQLEQARIKVQEESPVFQILEPARVPLRKSGPKRTAIVVGFTVAGVIIGIAVALMRKFFFR